MSNHQIDIYKGLILTRGFFAELPISVAMEIYYCKWINLLKFLFLEKNKKIYQGENEINKLGILQYFTGAHTIYTRKTLN